MKNLKKIVLVVLAMFLLVACEKKDSTPRVFVTTDVALDSVAPGSVITFDVTVRQYPIENEEVETVLESSKVAINQNVLDKNGQQVPELSNIALWDSLSFYNDFDYNPITNHLVYAVPNDTNIARVDLLFTVINHNSNRRDSTPIYIYVKH